MNVLPLLPKISHLVSCTVLCVFLQPGLALAETDSPSVAVERLHQTTLGILEAMVKKGILTQEDADAIVASAKDKAKSMAAVEAPKAMDAAAVRVPYVPEIVKRELREQIQKDMAAQAKAEGWVKPGSMPEWVSRIQVSGDVRFRYQTDRLAGSNAVAAQYFDNEDVTNFVGLRNSDIDQNRARVRARLAINAYVSDDVKAGLRFSTGNQTSPVSSSSTAGDSSNRYGIKLDRAFIRYSPKNYLSFEVGRISNPFVNSELIFATDLGFDGLATVLKRSLEGSMKPFATFGVFPLKNDTFSGNRKLMGLQLGTDWAASDKVNLKFALSRYKFDGAAGKPMADRFDPAYNSTEYEAGFRQRGNTLFRINQDPFVTAAPVYGLAGDYSVHSLFASLEIKNFDPLRLTLTGESIVNTGFNVQDVANRVGITGIEARNRGHMLRMVAGSPRITKRGDWQLGFGVRKLERDATLDALTDPDFGLGGTNVKGQFLTFSYGIDKNTDLGFRYLTGETIDAPLSNPGIKPLRVRTLQLDMNVRF